MPCALLVRRLPCHGTWQLIIMLPACSHAPVLVFTAASHCRIALPHRPATPPHPNNIFCRIRGSLTLHSTQNSQPLQGRSCPQQTLKIGSKCTPSSCGCRSQGTRSQRQAAATQARGMRGTKGGKTPPLATGTPHTANPLHQQPRHQLI